MSARAARPAREILAVLALVFFSAGPRLWTLSAQSDPPLPDSGLPITLVGIALDSISPAGSVCFLRCPSSAGSASAAGFKSGQTACNLAEIAEIHERTVVIKNLHTNRLELLTFGRGGSSPDPPPQAADDPLRAPVVTGSPELVTVDLRKDLVDHYLSNLDEVLNSALAVPRHSLTGGQEAVEGFQLDRIKEGGAADLLGFRNGDVILEVNGVKLDGLDAVLRLVGQARSTPTVQMAVLRDGQRMTFVFNTR